MNYGGLHPAVVDSYTPGSRFCMVKIPGVTDGADGVLEAEIAQSLGDKSEHTEIRILPGDRVWVMFMGGDPKHPIITHFRAKAAGNEVGTRRFHHENIETDADETQKHTAGTTYRVEAGQSATIISGDASIKVEPGKITSVVGASTITQEGSQIEIQVGGKTFLFNSSGLWTDGDVVANTISLLSHIHQNTKPGTAAETSGTPKP